ncbi:MAG: hypothetical protein HYR66_16285 [Sphingobacteriales bacterium]|nr:hypothetical protein [Sphingobacteriales bacterium]MBI3718427.1 hypothetical protein [Sphingobacteriales bacterium]
MNKVFLICFLVLLNFSCSTQPPNEQEIKTKVYEYYQQQASLPNGNQYNVQEVSILSVSKDSTGKNVFDVTALTKGTFSNLSIPKPIQDKPFIDTLKMAMEWNGARWTTVPR